MYPTDGETTGESSYDVYQVDTSTQNDLYEASSEAQLAGDSYGSYELNAASIEAGADANTAWQDWANPGTETTDTSVDTSGGGYEAAPEASTYDAGSYDAGTSDVQVYDTGTETYDTVSSYDSSSSE